MGDGSKREKGSILKMSSHSLFIYSQLNDVVVVGDVNDVSALGSHIGRSPYTAP